MVKGAVAVLESLNGVEMRRADSQIARAKGQRRAGEPRGRIPQQMTIPDGQRVWEVNCHACCISPSPEQCQNFSAAPLPRAVLPGQRPNEALSGQGLR